MSEKSSKQLRRVQLTGIPGPLEDREEYENRLNELPLEQKELALESTRLADLCQYFSQQKIDLPVAVMEQIGTLARLPIGERLQVLKRANAALMEYLNDVGQDPKIRQ